MSAAKALAMGAVNYMHVTLSGGPPATQQP